ncbi:hypothetical protein V8B97DRAFT_2004429 [Scleroderma yunnanense]
MSSETPEEIAREAKGIHQGLKELLKTRSPWDKEVEFNRKNLRRLYLRLLLLEPYAKESKDAETHLWMQTSYPFISQYKQDIATLDRALPQQRTHSSRKNHPQQQHDHRQHGPVEYRRLMQRFRQFLAEEEKFWIAFVARYCRQFAISEAQPALHALGVIPSTIPVRIPELGDSGDNESADPITTNTTHHVTDGDSNSASRPQRDHSGFPPEDTITPPLPPGLTEEGQRTARLAILAKAFVCLGDIARYRELYNESGGRPRAGQEDGPGAIPARRGRHRRSGPHGLEQVARARTYNRSISFYEHARALVPSDGNAAHQLAILSFYGGDVFDALYWYLRALCVKGPYEAAVENLRKVLGRTMGEGATRWVRESTKGGEEEEVPVKVKVDRMKDNIVLLHALLRVGAERLHLDPNAISSDITENFRAFVSERVLPIDMVTRVVVLAQGALWNHRMLRDSARASSHPQKSRRTTQDTTNDPNNSDLDTPATVELRLLTHLLTLHRVLLEVGTAQLATPPPPDVSDNDLAPKITAAFRRMLPALRAASKWIVGNVGYVIKATSSSSCGHEEGDSREESALRDVMSLLYNRFAEFYTALGKVFPIDKLPRLEAPLDEDVDLRGFLPLRGRMRGDEVADSGKYATADSTGDHQRDGDGPRQNDGHAAVAIVEKVHPNEEQLMRIWDLLMDAKGLTDIEGFPVHMEGSTFVFGDAKYTAMVENEQPIVLVTNSLAPGLQADPTSPPNFSKERGREWMHRRHQEYLQHPHPEPVVACDQELDDDAMTDTGRTDDDPVRDAFRQVLDNHDSSENGEGMGNDEDEDEIVWNPRPIDSASKVVVPTASITLNTDATTTQAQTVGPTWSSPPKELTVAPSSSPTTRPILSPPNRAASFSKPKSPSTAAGTTAQDLLNNVMGLGTSKSGLRSGNGLGVVSPWLSSSQLPPLLFGGSQNAPVSIWSTSLDEDPVQHQYHTPAMNVMALGTENGVDVIGQNQTYPNIHAHSLSMSPPGVGLASGWPPSLGALQNGSANARAPQRSLGMRDGLADPTLSPTVYQPTLHDDPSIRHAPRSPILSQSFQTPRGPDPSHQRSLSLSVSGPLQVMHQAAAFPSHGMSGLSGVSTGSAAPGLGLLAGGTVSAGGPSRGPGHFSLSSYPSSIGRSPALADPAIHGAGPVPTTMPMSGASRMGIFQFEAYSNGGTSAQQQQYLRPGHQASWSMSSRIWGANV